jgi:peptidoglycan/LPS O-acetylase OafA/YrhL
MHFALPDVIAVSFFPFILLSGAYGSAGINKFFGTAALQRLGDWSFSLYLVHQPLLYTIGKVRAYLNPVSVASLPMGPPPKSGMLTGWIIWLGIIALALFISYLTFIFIERPARELINPKVKSCVLVKLKSNSLIIQQ